MIKWILLSLVFILFFALFLYYTKTVKKGYKKEQDDFENGDHLETKPMQKFNTQANTMFVEPLENALTPLQITECFVKDYEAWRAYAWKESENKTAENEWNIGKSYDNLIIKYCGKDKQYQGLTYGDDSEKWSDFKILETFAKVDTSIVKVQYTDPKFNFIERMYEYHFTKNHGQWLLVEKYFIDDQNQKNPYL